MKYCSIVFYGIMLVGMCALIGCEASKENEEGIDGKKKSASNLSGSISIEGSSTVQPIANVAEQKFKELNPKVAITIGGTGSSNGLKALSAKECDIADASRHIKKKEVDACKEAGVEFIEVPVAYDGLTICVNKKNDFIDQLTVDQLKKIFRKDLGVKTWKEVNEAWPDKEIVIYAPGPASGTYDYFMEVMDKDKTSGIRETQISRNEDDKILVQGVKGSEYSIGFFGFAYFEGNKEDLRAVPIVNPKTNEPVAPSMSSIESAEYAPFSRPLFMYVNKQMYQKIEVEQFVNDFLDNANEIVKKAKYVPLPESLYEAARENLERGAVGTHYFDENGNKRSGSLTEVFKMENLKN